MTVGSFCPSCGAVVRPAALYCSSCGAAAETAATAPPVSPPFTVGTVGAVVGGDQLTGAVRAAVPGAAWGGQHPGAESTVRYPPFGRRVGALVIDTVPVLIAITVVWVCWPADPSTLWWVMVGGVAVVILAAALVLAALGRSPGSAVWGLRVVRENTGAAPGSIGVGRLLLKYLLLIATLSVAGFSPLWDGERRGRAWWDKIVGTVVVSLVRAPPAGHDPSPSAYDMQAWDIPAGSRSTTGRANRAAGSAVWADRPAHSRPVPENLPMADPVASAPGEAVSPPPAGGYGADGRGFAAEPPWAGELKQPSGLITSVPGRVRPEPGPAPVVEAPPGPSVDEPIDHTRMATPAAVPEAERGWQLTFDDGRTLPLDGPLIVGRNPSLAPDESSAAVLALVDEDRSVSKTHLRIDIRDATVFVTDRHSTNGVSVQTGTTTSNCAPGVPTTVPAGSTVKFGDREFLVSRR